MVGFLIAIYTNVRYLRDMDVSASLRIAVVLIFILPLSSMMGCLELDEAPAPEQEVTVGYTIGSNETVYNETRPEYSWAPDMWDSSHYNFSRFFNITDGEVASISVSLRADWTRVWNNTVKDTDGLLEVAHESEDDGVPIRYDWDMTTMDRTAKTAPDWRNITWTTADIAEEYTMKRRDAEKFISDFSDDRSVGEWELHLTYNETYSNPAFTIGVFWYVNWTVTVDVAHYEPMILG